MPDVSKLELSALAWHEVVHFRSAVKIQTFSPVFRQRLHDGVILLVIPLESQKNKSSTASYDTA